MLVVCGWLVIIRLISYLASEIQVSINQQLNVNPQPAPVSCTLKAAQWGKIRRLSANSRGFYHRRVRLKAKRVPLNC